MTGRRALRSRAGGAEVTFTVLLSIHIHISNVTVGIVNEDARAASLAEPVCCTPLLIDGSIRAIIHRPS